jgi:uncharacterized protein DUF3306
VSVAEEKEKFLSRWSRLKRENENKLPEKGQESASNETPAPVLPPVEQLTPESDFTGFMHPKVEDALRRVALKKLFSDPHFNVPDPYEPFSGDWTGGEPISEEMLATLNQARTLLFDKDGKKEGQEKTADADPAAAENLPEQRTESKDDDDGRKDA